MRTEAEEALFRQGLDCLGTLYSHPYTFVLRLTSFPDGHKTEDQPEGTNVAKYFDRGWSYTESSWASLTKSSALSLDLGRMRDDMEYHYFELRDGALGRGCEGAACSGKRRREGSRCGARSWFTHERACRRSHSSCLGRGHPKL